MVNAQISGISDDELIDFLKNRAIWLEPWNIIQSDSIPVLGLLSRIKYAISKVIPRPATTNNAEYVEHIKCIAELELGFQRCQVSGVMGLGTVPNSRNYDYAVEIMQTENAKLEFPSQFRKLMEIVTERLFKHSTGISQSPVYCAIFEDYDLHWADQMPFILKLQQFLPDEVHVFICCDVPHATHTPSLSGHFRGRAPRGQRTRFHQFLTQDFQRIRLEVLKNSYFRGGSPEENEQYRRLGESFLRDF